MWDKIKYFVDYINHSDDNIKLLLIKLPKLNGSKKSFERLNYISLMVNKNMKI